MDGRSPDSVLVVPEHFQVGAVKEMNVDEVQRAIMEEIFLKLQDSGAVTLEYPSEHVQADATELKPHYENGAKLRFAGLNNSGRLGRDEIYVYVLENTSASNSQSKGLRVNMSASGVHSGREIGLARFAQNPRERLNQTGTFWGMNLSENMDAKSATFSAKGRAYNQKTQPFFDREKKIPTFAERWNSGSGQLWGAGLFYGGFGEALDFKESDYADILTSIKKAKVDSGLTKRVIDWQQTNEFAKVLSGDDSLKKLPQG